LFICETPEILTKDKNMQWCFVPQKNISHNIPSLPRNKTRNSDVKDTESFLTRKKNYTFLELLQILFWRQMWHEQLQLNDEQDWASTGRENCSFLLWDVCQVQTAHKTQQVLPLLSKRMWCAEQREWNTCAHKPRNSVTCILILFLIVIYW